MFITRTVGDFFTERRDRKNKHPVVVQKKTIFRKQLVKSQEERGIQW